MQCYIYLECVMLLPIPYSMVTSMKTSEKSTEISTGNVIQHTYVPYPHHHNLWLVYFKPTFFEGAFFLRFWPYVRMVSIQERVMVVRIW